MSKDTKSQLATFKKTLINLNFSFVVLLVLICASFSTVIGLYANTLHAFYMLIACVVIGGCTFSLLAFLRHKAFGSHHDKE